MAQGFSRTDHSVEAGFRRIALAEIDAAIAAIDAHGPTPEDKIHKVRRQLKALRALLRLVRPSFTGFGRENRTFRDMARRLSGSRDARVMLDTFDAITGDAIAAHADAHAPMRSFRRVRERLCDACDSHADADARLARVRTDLVAARGRAAHWSLSQEEWAALRGGIERTYGQACRAMRATLATGDAESSHEWRKGVKYHGAQARLLRTMKPDALKADMKASSRLGDLLGQRHDIDLFLDMMARAPARFGDIVTVTQLAGLARLRLARLDRQARRLGETLFDRKPEKLAARWGEWWEAWRG